MINDATRLRQILIDAIDEQAKAYDQADAAGNCHVFEYKMVTICVNGFSFDFEYGSDVIQTIIETIYMKEEYDLTRT